MGTMTVLPPTLDTTLNISTLRAPLASSHAPSMADTLPATIEFGFDGLRSHMAAFTQRFDDFIERGRRRVLEERNAYRGRAGEMNDQQAKTDSSIERLQSQTSHHSSLLASQATETAEMHTAIASLTSQRDAQASNNATLQSRVKSQKATLARLKSAQRDRNEFLNQQRGLDGEELSAWQEGLGLSIEGTGEDERVRFIFWDEAGKRQELGRFELDMREGGWKVVGASPKVDALGAGRERVEDLCRAMSECEDLGAFLKGMRGMFQDARETR